MSNRIEGAQEQPAPPPFNIVATYEQFMQNAIPVDKWDADEALMHRFKELSLPIDLYPDCYAQLETGAMLMIWEMNDQGQLGYALHQMPEEE